MDGVCFFRSLHHVFVENMDAALARTAARLFQEQKHYRYMMRPRYPDFEAMVARVTGQTFNDIRRERVETAEVRALFEAGPTPAGDHAFDQPMLLAFYRGRRAAD